MKEKILDLLRREVPEIDFMESDTLVDDGILDSMAITEVISVLTMEYGITIPYEELNEDNFNSLDGITSMVERLKKN